jgi:hypothetical protein
MQTDLRPAASGKTQPQEMPRLHAGGGLPPGRCRRRVAATWSRRPRWRTDANTLYVYVKEEKKALETLLRRQDKASPGRPRAAPKVPVRSRTPASPSYVKKRGHEETATSRETPPEAARKDPGAGGAAEAQNSADAPLQAKHRPPPAFAPRRLFQPRRLLTYANMSFTALHEM